MRDERRRRSERLLAVSPGDGAAWARLSREHQRAGQSEEAMQVALRGHRAHPEDPVLRERLGELGVEEGPWPSPDANPCNTQGSVLPGPDEGIQRWRIELPRQPIGRPLIDLEGRVVVRTEPSGLARVSADARRAEVVHWTWPTEVPPLLRRGAPTGFDPALGDLTSAELLGEVPLPKGLCQAQRDAAGRVYGFGAERVFATSVDGVLLWSRPLPHPRHLAAPPQGPIYVALADPVIGRDSAFDHPGRVLALDRDTGATLRSFAEGRSLCGDGQLAVAVAGDGALVSQLGMDLFCDGPDGERRWTRKLEWAAPPAVGKEVVVVASTIEGLLALDLQTGEQRWRQPELRTSRAPALDARGHTYAAGQGWFVGVDARGEQLFHLPLPSRGPLGSVAIGYERTAFFTIGQELVAVR